MLDVFAEVSPQTGIFNFLFTQGVLGVMCVGLIVAVVYLVRKNEKMQTYHAAEVKGLNRQLLDDSKAHALDYREMAKDNQEVLQLNSQNSALLTAKIEAVKGR